MKMNMQNSETHLMPGMRIRANFAQFGCATQYLYGYVKRAYGDGDYKIQLDCGLEFKICLDEVTAIEEVEEESETGWREAA